MASVTASSKTFAAGLLNCRVVAALSVFVAVGKTWANSLATWSGSMSAARNTMQGEVAASSSRPCIGVRCRYSPDPEFCLINTQPDYSSGALGELGELSSWIFFC